MGFQNIRIINFRNIRTCNLQINSPIIILQGNNGQGKTNFLEAVYYLCYGNSFRTRREKEVICYETDFFSLAGKFTNHSDHAGSVGIQCTEKGKKIVLNEKRIYDRKEFIYQNPCVVFSHEDMLLIKGEHETRRRFFNQILCLNDILFLDSLRKYNKVLRMKNALLKKRTYDLDVYNQQLSNYGLDIITKRKKLTEKVNTILPDLFSEIAHISEKVTLQYSPSWKEFNIDDIRQCLKEREYSDIQKGFSSTGPHRDRFTVLFDRRDASKTASTGQIRLIVLILRIIQAKMYADIHDVKPVLLLDDVLLELDPEKRMRLFHHLPAFEQAFFTFLPDEKYSQFDMPESCHFSVKEGNFTRVRA